MTISQLSAHPIVQALFWLWRRWGGGRANGSQDSHRKVPILPVGRNLYTAATDSVCVHELGEDPGESGNDDGGKVVTISMFQSTLPLRDVRECDDLKLV